MSNALYLDLLGLRVPGVYKIPFARGAYYTEQMGWSVHMRKKEYQSYIRLGHIDKSALAEHAWATGHTIQFDQNKILFKSEDWRP